MILYMQIGSVTGMICIIWAQIMQFVLYPQMFLYATWGVWLSTLTMPVISCCLGYFLSIICGLAHTQSITVAYETGCQNNALATAVIMLSYPLQVAIVMQFIPMIYGVFQIFDGFLSIGIFKLAKLSNRKYNDVESQKPPEIHE